MTYDEMPNAAHALGKAGCADASIRGHVDGMELLFERAADSLQAAIASVIADVERAGDRVSKIDMEREAIPGQHSVNASGGTRCVRRPFVRGSESFCHKRVT